MKRAVRRRVPEKPRPTGGVSCFQGPATCVVDEDAFLEVLAVAIATSIRNDLEHLGAEAEAQKGTGRAG